MRRAIWVVGVVVVMTVDPGGLIGLAGVPVVIALVQVVKASFPSLSSRWYPALVLGIAVAFNLGLAALLGQPLAMAALVGIVAGLSASGLYSHAVALFRDDERSASPVGQESSSPTSPVSSTPIVPVPSSASSAAAPIVPSSSAISVAAVEASASSAKSTSSPAPSSSDSALGPPSKGG